MIEKSKDYLAEQFSFQPKQLITYVSGLVLFSLGAKMFIEAKLGTDPLDVLVIGMNQHLHIGLGTCSGIVAIFFLSWWTAWNRKFPPISPFVSTAAVGYFIDLWNYVQLELYTVQLLPVYEVMLGNFPLNLVALLIVVAALLCCSYASALIIMSGIGIRIMDLVAITMIEKWQWSFFRAKMVLEVGLFLSGWVLGGPMGITTIAFLFLVGPFIQPFMSFNAKYLGMINHGIKK
jgi:uncharacterized protein